MFLLAGPDRQSKARIVSSLEETLQWDGAGYDLSARSGQDPEALFQSGGAVDPRDEATTTLVDHLKTHPGAMIVLGAITKAHPAIITRLQTAWRTGVLHDSENEAISLAGTTFMLVTNVAEEPVGQLARDETDPDRLHVASLRMLLDAGFPASLLTSINRVFCLRRNTAGEQVRALYRWIVMQIEAHGFQYKPGDIDARILVEWMDPPVGESAAELENQLIELLTKARAEGETEFQLIFDNWESDAVPED
ncbi:hypothetical protein [Microvirga brassicacearum]|uniref:ATPase n=1 Tax=Microvirga brassicacearum TaxID=2580413 RepID=A0A5N3PDU5_9HYPH|nr:hypothetical protein [Microvirga brassicacearum]KAB0267870.1 hypothetical protein FEZ63_07615 [Microvirga brassicacearum]